MKNNILKKMFIIFGCIICSSLLTGCEFKLFEKVEDSDKNEDEDDLGNIDKDAPSVEKEKPEENSDNFITVAKIKFEKEEKPTTLYVKNDTWGYSLPNDSTKNKEKELDQGQEVKRIGLSTDGTWAMIENGNSQIYIKTELLSIDKVKTKAEIEAEEKKKEEEAEKQKQEEEKKKQEEQNSSNNGGSTNNGGNTNLTPQPKPPTPSVQGGISYPGGNDTSVNFGVTFANTNFTAKVVSQCSANTGPGKAVPSTGYTVIQWFYAGDTVQVTGIGQNGYIRVSVNGQTGFILNTKLSR